MYGIYTEDVRADVLEMYVRCMGDVWGIYGIYTRGVSEVYGDIRDMYGRCTVGVREKYLGCK